MIGDLDVHLTFIEFTKEAIVAPNKVPMTPAVAPIVANLVE
jgi:hypothetical protein